MKRLWILCINLVMPVDKEHQLAHYTLEQVTKSSAPFSSLSVENPFAIHNSFDLKINFRNKHDAKN